MRDFLLFTIDDRFYALPLENVIRAVRMVEVTPLPDVPPGIAGVINYHGQIVPVFDLRQICGMPNRPWRPSDHLLLAKAEERTLALPVDAAESVFSRAEAELLSLEHIVPGLAGAEGIAILDGDIVLIYDLGRFLAAIDVPLPQEGERTAP